MEIKQGLWYLEVTLNTWKVDFSSRYFNEETEHVLVGDLSWMCQADYIAVPLQLSDYPYLDNFRKHFLQREQIVRTKTRIIPANTVNIPGEQLVYLTKGMVVKIYHPAVNIVVPFGNAEGSFDVEIDSNMYLYNRFGTKPKKKSYTYPVLVQIADVTVRNAYYVPVDGQPIPENVDYVMEKRETMRYGDRAGLYHQYEFSYITEDQIRSFEPLWR